MLSVGKKVWILSSRKTDGRYNRGQIVGTEKMYNLFGFRSEAQYFRDFKPYRYKVAYVDCFTGKACCEWIHYSNVSVNKPEEL